MNAMHHIAGRMFNAPLMLDITKAQIIANSFAPRVLGGDVTVNNLIAADGDGLETRMGVLNDAVARRADRWGGTILDEQDGVAIIEISGSLAHKGSYIGKSSGVMSYEGIAAQVTAARDDPGVRGVVFDVDSFGGEVPGCFDLAETINELAQDKPTTAILTDHSCSAAYLLASACDSIMMPETGIVGSIGVVMMHVDYSQHLEAAGVNVTLLHDGAHKVDGHPYAALPEDVAERLQDQLAGSRDLFAETVGHFRGDRFNKAEALATQAQTYHGREAYDLGLVDAVARPGKAFEAFLNQIN